MLKRTWLGLLIMTLFVSHVAHAQPELTKESRLKAAYLLNFTLFISWPEQELDTQTQTITLCLQGSEAFLQFANELAAGRKFSNDKRQVQIQSLSSTDKCDLSFIQQKNTTLPNHLKTSVIVADSELVQLDNTAITFFRQQRKLRFEINLLAMQKLEVSVSSELLKLAKVKTE